MSYVNEIVDVNAFYFCRSFGRLKTFPRQIQLGDQQFTFSEGLQYLIRRGHHIIQLFDMVDQDRIYRLRLEDSLWTLVGTESR